MKVKKFDLANGTGVCNHSPHWQLLHPRRCAGLVPSPCALLAAEMFVASPSVLAYKPHMPPSHSIVGDRPCVCTFYPIYIHHVCVQMGVCVSLLYQHTYCVCANGCLCVFMKS